MQENWKDLPGWAGKYAVSDLGKILRKRTLSSIGRTLPDRIFVPYVAKHGGYLTVTLQGKQRKTVSIHSLVLQAFIGPRPTGYDINHINGVRTDNRLSNLEYCTRSQNELHKRRVLLSSVGSKMYNAKLTESDIPKIRAMRMEGETHQSIAIRFQVSRRLIGGIVNGTRWRHVP